MRHPDAVIPFVPVRYSEAEGRLADIMAGRKAEAGVRIGNLPAIIRLCWAPPGRESGEPVLAVMIRGRLWQVSLDETRGLYGLLEAADAKGLFRETPPESLPDQILWAIVESFLGPELSRLEARLETAVALAEPDPDPEGLSLPFSILFKEDQKVTGMLHLPEEDLDFLEKMVAGCQRQTWSPEEILALEKQVPVRAGFLNLDREAFLSLEAGDVLIPDLWLPSQGGMAMGFTSDWFFCRMDTRAMTLIPEGIQNPWMGSVAVRRENAGPKTNHNQHTEEHPFMDEETIEEKPEEKAGEIIPRPDLDLDLNLVFELGRMTMTVAQISELAQGQTIRLQARPGAGIGVDIRINDRVVARGQIVSVGQDTGIQITEIGAVCSI